MYWCAVKKLLTHSLVGLCSDSWHVTAPYKLLFYYYLVRHPVTISCKQTWVFWVDINECVGQGRWCRDGSFHGRLTGLVASPVTSRCVATICLTNTVVDKVQELEVGQRTAQGVGVGHARPANDEVGRAGAAWKALAADIVHAVAADRLRVDGSRQRWEDSD